MRHHRAPILLAKKPDSGYSVGYRPVLVVRPQATVFPRQEYDGSLWLFGEPRARMENLR